MRLSPTSTAIAVLLLAVVLATNAFAGNTGKKDFSTYEWTEVNDDAEWSPRAGLQVVVHRDQFYLLGGRTPKPPTFPPIPGDSEIWGDVWKSTDRGASWVRILETDDASHWPARAYFRALKKGRFMYVLGGQNFKVIPNPAPVGPPFISQSDFFNDVWRSLDGINWQQMTAEAGWHGRAGLSAVVFNNEIYVMAGSFNDDPAVIGGPPTRVYFNDVWKSRDGQQWTQVTAAAPWAKRAGAILVVKNGWMYLLGGEDGFTCLPGGRCPPYYNDVWRTRNGRDWQLVTESAEWSPRPGHQAVVIDNQIVLFGGFGLSFDPDDPFAAANPMDMWVSRNGRQWKQFSDSPWNATGPEDIKYDFAAVVAPKREGNKWSDNRRDNRNDSSDDNRSGGRSRMAIYTFGGDRETFDFEDLENYRNVDNDVWEFHAPRGSWGPWLASETMQLAPAGPAETRLLANVPNPFNPTTTISFELTESADVTLQVFDVSGKLVRTLVDRNMSADRHSVVWDGRNAQGVQVSSGVYFYRLNAAEFTQIRKMVMLK